MDTVKIEEITQKDLGNRQTVRENSKAVSEDIVQISLDKIVIREGFNVRQDYGNIEELAISILENGQALPGRVDCLENGTFVLTDGHRRFEAMKWLVKQGHETPFFKAIVNPKRTTEEQRILQMFITQDNKPLTPHETAEVFNRLTNLGYTLKEISTKVGKSITHISQMLEYAQEPPAIKEHVKSGRMTVATVNRLRKEIPSVTERIAAVNKSVGENTKKKVTTRTVVGNINEKRLATKISNKILETYDVLIDKQELTELILGCL